MENLIDNRFTPPIVPDDEYYQRIKFSNQIIKNIEQKSRWRETIVPTHDVEDYVFKFFKVSGKRDGRKRPRPQCRAIIAMLLHQQHGWGCSQIADYLGIDHATILYHFKSLHKDVLPHDRLLSPMVNRIKGNLKIVKPFVYRPFH